jgi:succinate dehydrogenase/fumarate reductase flavoprotein subunit
VISGETLGELADNIEARVESLSSRIGGYHLEPGFKAELEKTVERFNTFARQGRDEDFGRGETALEYDWTGPGHPENTGNPTMYPFADSGPYHCIIMCGGVLDTNGGPRTNDRAQVVRPDGSTIPGLYGAGNCVASAAAGAYWSGGSTLGPATTFAYIAANNVVREPVRDLTAVRGIGVGG